MATIETVTETITQEVFILKYTRSELEDFASKPQRYLTDILDALDGSKKKPLKPAAKKDKPAKVDQFKTYPCKICKRSFKKAGNLDRHQADVHDNTTEIGTYKSESSD